MPSQQRVSRRKRPRVAASSDSGDETDTSATSAGSEQDETRSSRRRQAWLREPDQADVALTPMPDATSLKRSYMQDYEGLSGVSSLEDTGGASSDGDTQPSPHLTERSAHRERLKYDDLFNDETCGRIMRVELKNFMGHTAFDIHMHPKMNFISGVNGAGKSAILTGIIVGLNGLLSIAGRGNNLSRLIRVGTNRAKIRLTLCNQGPSKYKRESYPDRIVVERVLQRLGENSCTTAWRVLDAHGGVLTKKRQEVLALFSYLNLVANNPVLLMSQNEFKKLLRSTPGMLYNFFGKATGLEARFNEYVSASDEIKTTGRHISSLREEAKQARSEIKELEDQLGRYEQLGADKSRLTQLQNELAWAVVRDKEIAHEELEEKATAVKAEVAQLQQDLAKMERGLQSLRPSDLDAEYRQKQDSTRQVQANFTVVQAEVRDCQAKVESAKDQLETAKTDLAREEKELKDIDRRIAEQQEKLNAHSRRGELQRKLEELKATIARTQQEIQTHEIDVETLTGRIGTTEDKRQDALKDTNEVKGRLNELEKERRQIQSMAKDANAAYGPAMSRLLAEIDRLQWRGKKPIGPAGQYVSILPHHQAFSSVIQSVLSRFLLAFVVTDSRDATQLQRLLATMARQQPSPGPLHTRHMILTLRPGDLHHEKGHPDPALLTTFRACRFTDQRIEHAAIIGFRVEQQVLMPDEDAALQFTRRGYPSRVMACLTPDCLSIGSKEPGMFRTVLNSPRGPSLIGAVNVARELERLARAMEDVKQELSGFEARCDLLASTRSGLERDRKRLQQMLQDKTRAISRFENEVQTVMDQIEEQPTQEMSALNTFRTEITKTIATARRQLPGLEKHVTDQEAVLTETQQKLFRLRNLLQKSQQAERAVLSRKENVQTEIKKLNHTIDVQRGTLRAKQQIVAVLETDAEDEAEKINVARAKATAVCPRCPTNGSSADYIQRITELEAKLEAATDNVDVDALTERFLVKKQALDRFQEHLQQATEFKEKNSSTLRDRMTMHENIFENKVSELKNMFSSMTHANDLACTLEVFRNQEKIILRGQTESSASSATYQSHRAAAKSGASSLTRLSGGEGSITSACFLMALWQIASPSPIRAIDEFDVYMDSVNSNRVADLIINHVRESTFQCLIITPTPSERIKTSMAREVGAFHRLAEPLR